MLYIASGSTCSGFIAGATVHKYCVYYWKDTFPLPSEVSDVYLYLEALNASFFTFVYV